MNNKFVAVIVLSDGYTDRMRVSINTVHHTEDGEVNGEQTFPLPGLANGQTMVEWLQQALAVVCDAV